VNSLFNFGQTLLHSLEPERAHDLAIKSLELGIFPHATEPDDKRLKQTVFGLDFPNPLGMAPGFDKNARVPQPLLDMGFGFVEVGTLTPRPQAGNEKPRIFRSATDRGIINRLGFNNEGQKAALRRLQQRPKGIIGINIGAGRDSEDRIADYVEGVERLAPVASYFTVNISSPNTPGLRDLQTPQALNDLLKRVQAARSALPMKPPLLIKLAPDLTEADTALAVGVIMAHEVDGIIVSNTTISRDGLRDVDFAMEKGGLSGRPLFARSTRMLARVFRLTEGKLPLIGVGGIDSGETALAKIEAGASLLQIYTGLIFEGPPLISRIKRALIEAMERARVDSLAPLIGSNAEDRAALG
jgi:dihydroorotate dehydrogenase